MQVYVLITAIDQYFDSWEVRGVCISAEQAKEKAQTLTPQTIDWEIKPVVNNWAVYGETVRNGDGPYYFGVIETEYEVWGPIHFKMPTEATP